MILEEQLKDILGLAVVPSDSFESIQWKNTETAEQDFYYYIHDLNQIHPYFKSEHGCRLRIARELIKTQMGPALLSSSPYVRRLAELISKEDDQEWLHESHKTYLRDSYTKMFRKEKVLNEEQIKISVDSLVDF